MNAFARFYYWLTPPVPFEFIIHFTPDQCVSDLTSKAGMRWGMFPQRLKVEVSQGSDAEYSFLINLRIWAYYQFQAQGAISLVGEDYSQIAGIVRATPTKLGMVLLAYV